MQLWFDKFGFPVLTVHECNLEMYLFPFTKLQLEFFLVESRLFTDSWYEELLMLNQRAPIHKLQEGFTANAFATGLLPKEIEQILHYQNEGFRLPTVEEWRTLCSHLDSLAIDADQLKTILNSSENQAVKNLVLGIWHQNHSWWSTFCLLRGGFVEWASSPNGPVGIGCPSFEIYPNLWDPMVDLIVPISLTERIKYFGFRPVRPYPPAP